MSEAREGESESLAKKYALDCKKSVCKYLIFHRKSKTQGEFIVFIDEDYDLDWELDDQTEASLNGLVTRANILSRTAQLEILVANWPTDLKITTKRLIGESIARLFCGDEINAEASLKSAKAFIMRKSKQVSRYWTLRVCLLAGATAASFLTLQVLLKDCIMPILGNIPYLLLLCFWLGCVGALLFSIMTLGGRENTDSTSEKGLHSLESIARITAGGISGVLLGGLTKLGFVLPVLVKTGSESLAICIAAMLAGASERLAAGVITKVDNSEIPKEGQNAGS